MLAAKSIINTVMRRRAAQLARDLMPLLPKEGRVLDIGSGTGHNVAALRSLRPDLEYTECDVVDIHSVGDGPRLMQNGRLPFDDGTFDICLLQFVLQYPDDPAEIVREARRVTAVGGRVIVRQTISRGRVGRLILTAHEHLWGPIAYQVSRALGAAAGGALPYLTPRRMFSPEELVTLTQRPGGQHRVIPCVAILKNACLDILLVLE